MPFERDWTRRDILKTAAAGGLASALNSTPARANDATPADPERIRRENEHQGTRAWMTTDVRIDPKTKYRSPWIEGYASRTSVRPGESITIHVSTNPPSPFIIEFYQWSSIYQSQIYIALLRKTHSEALLIQARSKG